MRGIRIALALTAALVMASIPASATDKLADEATDNIKRLTRVPISIDEETGARGSDLAFQGKLVVAGSYEGFGLFKILNKKPYLKQLSFFNCPGSQGDVSIWGKYVFISIDSATSNNGSSSICNNTDESTGKEGLRIVDISNPRQPRQVKFVATDCGSHTHTLAPAGKKLYVYIESYPLTQQDPTCNPVAHRQVSVVEVPLADVTKSSVVSTPDVSPAIGCHDVTVNAQRKLAVAACITESQLWDIKDPANPVILSRIRNPQIMIHHSSGFTWDGKYIALGDEYGGAAAPGGCSDQDALETVGAMWFYDVSDPTAPQHAGHFHVKRTPPSPPDSQGEADRYRCTTHNFNILPMKDPKKYIAVASYYAAGLSVIDFSDPANAKEIAYYMPADDTLSDMWSAYWYNGKIYSNDHASRFGVSVFNMKELTKPKVHYFSGRLNPQVQVPSFK